MTKDLKLYSVDFEPLYPVGCGLILLAENMQEAIEIAKETIKHTDIFHIQEVEYKKGVVFYASGNY